MSVYELHDRIYEHAILGKQPVIFDSLSEAMEKLELLEEFFSGDYMIETWKTGTYIIRKV